MVVGRLTEAACFKKISEFRDDAASCTVTVVSGGIDCSEDEKVYNLGQCYTASL